MLNSFLLFHIILGAIRPWWAFKSWIDFAIASPSHPLHAFFFLPSFGWIGLTPTPAVVPIRCIERHVFSPSPSMHEFQAFNSFSIIIPRLRLSLLCVQPSQTSQVAVRFRTASSVTNVLRDARNDPQHWLAHARPSPSERSSSIREARARFARIRFFRWHRGRVPTPFFL